MRKIEALDDHEHLLLRPNMYVGSIEPIDEKIIIYDNERKIFVNKTKRYSEGFYRILDEVIDNTFDEAKRCFVENHSFEKITIQVDSKTNKVTVIDSGRGFINGEQINEKTGLSNIETAMTRLKAGSNFRNENFNTSIIGMNGIGVSATNILSEEFEIKTNNGSTVYEQKWNSFVTTSKTLMDSPSNEETGTSISFIPRKKVVFSDGTTKNLFTGCKWDFEILFTKLLFRKFQIENTEELKQIKIVFIFDNETIDLNIPLVPENHIKINLNKKATIYIWDCSDINMSKMSFVNSSLCTGFHQTYIEEFISENIFHNSGANQFYRSMILLNLKPKHVQFQEQNKNRFVASRNMMENILPLKLTKNDLNEIQKCTTFQTINTRIEEFENKKYFKKIKKQKPNSFKVSDKFFSSIKKENLLICEGLSALGGLSQKRNPEVDAIYALTGKIKNVKDLGDLTDNKVILEIINILGLDINDRGEKCDYKKIIIACDMDMDGISISSLLINLFYRWFPKLILNNKLFLLKTPLITYELNGKNIHKYETSDLLDIPKEAKSIRYLKGLGSLSVQDWDIVFKKMNLVTVCNDSMAPQFLNIVFGDDIKKRKKWLVFDK